jgi:hypothetical protein
MRTRKDEEMLSVAISTVNIQFDVPSARMRELLEQCRHIHWVLHSAQPPREAASTNSAFRHKKGTPHD